MHMSTYTYFQNPVPHTKLIIHQTKNKTHPHQTFYKLNTIKSNKNHFITYITKRKLTYHTPGVPPQEGAEYALVTLCLRLRLPLVMSIKNGLCFPWCWLEEREGEFEFLKEWVSVFWVFGFWFLFYVLILFISFWQKKKWDLFISVTRVFFSN